MIKKIITQLPIGLRIYLVEKKGYKNFWQYYRSVNQLKSAFNIYEQKITNFPIYDDLDIWKQSFKQFLLAQPTEKDVAISFVEADIKVLKNSIVCEYKNENNEPILICVVKDDLYRIERLFEHYRKIGIKHFAILDNDSTDGTLEYLLQQDDANVFQTTTSYSSMRREAWINRIIAYYGVNRWYLNVDSDELLVFNECESKGIGKLVNYFESRGIKRARALMIDMYSENQLFDFQNNTSSYEDYCYFDKDSYLYQSNDTLDLIIGGPRGRVFQKPIWLTKYPLFKFEKGDIQGKSHFQFPYKKNKETACYMGLLHYKFLSGDLEKYKNIVKNENYYGGSVEYKKYIEAYQKDKCINFMYSGSHQFIDSNSVYEIDILEKVSWLE